jgi:hypothetical protein
MTTKVKASTLADTAVSAGTYGGSSQQTVVTVDQQGRITFAANVTPIIGATHLANTQTYGISVNGTSVTGTTVSDTKGNVRALTVNSQSGAYTLVAGDVGKMVSTTAGVTVPVSTFVAGDNVTIYNNSSSSITITCSAVTVYRAGITTASTSLALGGRGVCTFLFYASDAAVVTGTV